MRKANLVIAVALALSACARDPFPAMQAKLDSFKGRPAQSLIARLGAPDDTDKNDDGKTYLWFRVNKSGPEFQEDFVDCTIKAYADKDDRITGFFYTGNNAGCGRYAHKLDEEFTAPRNFLGL
jgi:hypothetical protein